MAMQVPYKTKKQARQSLVETDFTKGMMFSDGVIPDGYVRTLVNFDFTLDGTNALKPRAGLRTSELIFPDMAFITDSDWLSNDVAIKYSKECVENGDEVRQFILGYHDDGEGKIWVTSSPKGTAYIDENDGLTSRVELAKSFTHSSSCSCKFYSTNLSEIHGVKLTEDAKTAFPVGAFLGNSFYFFDDNVVGQTHVSKLRKTYYNGATSKYEFNATDLSIKTPAASEAVNYGYNMLLSAPYTFSDQTGASVFEMEGILPYDSRFTGSNTPVLLMTPKRNSRIWFRCYYNIPSSGTYDIVWSWKEVSADEWTEFGRQTGIIDITTPLQASLIAPTTEVLVRCEAYKYESGTVSEVVDKAMTVGFDFSLEDNQTISNVEQKNYDLTTATGMYSWKNRLVLWGVPEDPTILWVSDLNEPTYFPYPNNITVFDEPIISVIELMDNLIVFTKSKVYQVTTEDGVSWSTSVVQSNLFINDWDKHLIQSVRNMLYFKSGNYYYMIVPKRESDTGELILAPITTPITDFFNRFSVNVKEIFRECFKEVDENGNVVIHEPESMVTYYNFLNYESIHNLYVYKYQGKYIHFDIVYNTASRYWKIVIYEVPHILYPFRNDATQRGLLASTSLLEVNTGGVSQGNRRCIQLYNWDDKYIEDIHVIADTEIVYSTTHEDVIITNEVVTVGDGTSTSTAGTVEGEVLNLVTDYVDSAYLSLEVLCLLGENDYPDSFNKSDIAKSLRDAAEELRETTIFPNKQMIDTGYRDSNAFINKRYRELQLNINNIDNANMEFGMDFRIAGEPRNTDFKYEVNQVIDELDSSSGIVYLDSVPYLSIDEVDVSKLNQWSIEKQLDSDISFWKVRAAISGKGVAPRMRLFTRKQYSYNLLGIGWVYRQMNMR